MGLLFVLTHDWNTDDWHYSLYINVWIVVVRHFHISNDQASFDLLTVAHDTVVVTVFICLGIRNVFNDLISMNKHDFDLGMSKNPIDPQLYFLSYLKVVLTVAKIVECFKQLSVLPKKWLIMVVLSYSISLF